MKRNKISSKNRRANKTGIKAKKSKYQREREYLNKIGQFGFEVEDKPWK